MLRRGAVPAITVAVLTLAGCGTGSDDSSTESGGDSGSSGTTVSIRDTDNGEVLATPDGMALYVSDQEKQQVLCKSSECEGIWSPLTLTAGQQPTAPESIQPDLSTIERPDGSSQVAFEGQPLYTFTFDRAAGQVNGDGETDSFDGVDFTWHVVRPSGDPAAPTSPTTSDSTGYGGFDY
jgi:predicted lipoprotein with Yx(FWY)xxD motif